MVQMSRSYGYDLWLGNVPETVELSCLMPNGVYIPLEANRNATLHEIKEDLFDEASKFPLHGTLHDASSYVFSCINSMAETEELLDENRRLSDVKPFVGVLRLVERKGDKAERVLNVQISHLIGKGLHEFDSLKNSEVNYFRGKMKSLADEMARGRQNKGWQQRLYYQFPPRISDSTKTMPKAIFSRLKDGHFVLNVKFENSETKFTFNVDHTFTPTQLLMQILHKRAMMTPPPPPSAAASAAASNSPHPHGPHHTKQQRVNESVRDFVLKACGREEYLVGDFPIISFVYIQEALSRDQTPVLVTVSVHSVPVHPENVYENPDCMDELNRTRSSFSTLTLRKKGKYISAWNIEEKFQFRVAALCKLNCDPNRSVEVGVYAGLFHGGKSLCESQKTCERVVSASGECVWEQDLAYDIRIRDIPRMARLCLVVFELSKNAKAVRARRLKDSKQDLYVNPMGWVNTTVYDFKNQLKSGAMTLYMWTYAEDAQSDDLLHPLGTVVSNPNIEHSTALTISFPKYHSEHTIIYPTIEKMLDYAKNLKRAEYRDEQLGAAAVGCNSSSSAESASLGSQSSSAYLEQIRLAAERDPLQEMHEQERKMIWSLRYDLMTLVPSLLPKLLDCVEWNDHREVAEMMSLLRLWPQLSAEKALELLDYAYADQAVRSFAVRCLFNISDEELSLFLLQLVQALKHESYLCCDLVEFLLKRALNNQKIGHFLFWHLRSEMHVASVAVRFGLILEAYCRGSQEHIRALTKQTDLLEKMRVLSDNIRMRKDNKDKAKQFLRDSLAEPPLSEVTSLVTSPLDPSHKLKRIKLEKCRVMDSKMRPLWLVFENDDPHGDDVYIIFKNGDDLRQDMLTLQMIRIMDSLWKNAGLDLRMNPYGCISTDNRVGLIDVVLQAETIANIQKEKGMFSATSAFRKGSLLAWLKDHNQTESSLNKAIEEFTFSCAGYCVATYVLGVADRHSDNIMVKRTGQLFHIDFGHILGHFKEKFGFRRERVPFVLTHDFVHVINRGQQAKKEALEFKSFQSLCERAFLILRQHGCLILSLFAMMISTGLPELSSEKDLNYLRETLVLDLSKESALTHFQSKFDEALCNSWKTSLNWASHNMAKNNKQ